MIYMASDLHFGHDRDFIYGPRGFNSIEEHDRAIIKNWNEIITPNDTVYVLGDLMLGDNTKGMNKISQLNGIINIVIGNHDTDSRLELYSDFGKNIAQIEYAYRLKYNKYSFFLTHYPTLTANIDDGKTLKRKVINICGHIHTKDKFIDWDKGCIYHAELDATNMRPISIEEIIKDIEKKEK